MTAESPDTADRLDLAQSLRARLDTAEADLAALEARNGEIGRMGREIARANAVLAAVRGLTDRCDRESGHWRETAESRPGLSAVERAEMRQAATEVRRVVGALRGILLGVTVEPAQEAREYRCPECDRWAPWTDGTLAADNDGIALFWCQTCSAEAPLDGLDSRPQEAAHRPGTLEAHPDKGTGVSGPENPAQAADRAEALREAAASLQAIADHATRNSDDWRDGVRYAATLLAHTADDLDEEPT